MESTSEDRPLPREMTRTGVVAVLRAPTAAAYEPVISALVAGGLTSVEVTLTTAGTIDEIPRLRERLGPAVELAVGTVTTPAEAVAAIEAGAQVIVTPTTEATVIEAVTARGVAVIPGGLSPTELRTGWLMGACAVKLFPASCFGPDYLPALRGPFPQLRIMPSGGISLDAIPTWIRAGAVAVSLGGPLLGDAFSGGSLAALTDRARRAIDAVGGAR